MHVLHPSQHAQQRRECEGLLHILLLLVNMSAYNYPITHCCRLVIFFEATCKFAGYHAATAN